MPHHDRSDCFKRGRRKCCEVGGIYASLYKYDLLKTMRENIREVEIILVHLKGILDSGVLECRNNSEKIQKVDGHFSNILPSTGPATFRGGDNACDLINSWTTSWCQEVVLNFISCLLRPRDYEIYNMRLVY